MMVRERKKLQDDSWVGGSDAKAVLSQVTPKKEGI